MDGTLLAITGDESRVVASTLHNIPAVGLTVVYWIVGLTEQGPQPPWRSFWADMIDSRRNILVNQLVTVPLFLFHSISQRKMYKKVFAKVDGSENMGTV